MGTKLDKVLTLLAARGLGGDGGILPVSGSGCPPPCGVRDHVPDCFCHQASTAGPAHASSAAGPSTAFAPASAGPGAGAGAGVGAGGAAPAGAPAGASAGAAGAPAPDSGSPPKKGAQRRLCTYIPTLASFKTVRDFWAWFTAVPSKLPTGVTVGERTRLELEDARPKQTQWRGDDCPKVWYELATARRAIESCNDGLQLGDMLKAADACDAYRKKHGLPVYSWSRMFKKIDWSKEESAREAGAAEGGETEAPEGI